MTSEFYPVWNILSHDDDGTDFSEPGFEFNESDDELLGEFTQEFLEDEELLIGDLSQGFAEATQVFKNLPLYYQVGSGFENQPGPFSGGSVFVEGVPDYLIYNYVMVISYSDASLNLERRLLHRLKFQQCWPEN
ncbi:uncharacterized protein [Parasteatoda tepidariorum]|uniref:uncharacterized protein n=1 Tax=Parasteatoda tepidariorum TaxID=114398 RepID=UPI0039BCCF8B